MNLASIFRVKADLHGTEFSSNSLSIQERINMAKPGDTIFIEAGIYREDNIVIDKPIHIIGENTSTTIIDGGGSEKTIISVMASDVIIEGLTIQNTTSSKPAYGIALVNVRNVILQNNIIQKTFEGIYVYNSSNCKILKNNITSNYVYGIHFSEEAINNSVIENFIMNNPTGILLGSDTCKCNTFFHNNFLNNTNPVYYVSGGNQFDNGIEGNYWSDYNGTDLDRDGVGDTPYPDPFSIIDNFPLMGLFKSFKEFGNSFEIVSNSTILKFAYNASLHQLTLTIDGLDSTRGFCRICIPYEAISPPYKVIIDNGKAQVLFFNGSVYQNGTHQWIYFTYIHSKHQIKVIPENSHLMLPFIILVKVALLSLKLRKH